jgi:uncharacterized membrane protein YqgA involved in biofilm formation
MTLAPLLATVAVSAALFTAIGLAFGGRLGQRYRQTALRIAGIVLIILAGIFTMQYILRWSV